MINLKQIWKHDWTETILIRNQKMKELRKGHFYLETILILTIDLMKWMNKKTTTTTFQHFIIVQNNNNNKQC